MQHLRIDFADLSSVFDGPMVVWLDTREDDGEERSVGIAFFAIAQKLHTRDRPAPPINDGTKSYNR